MFDHSFERAWRWPQGLGGRQHVVPGCL